MLFDSALWMYDIYSLKFANGGSLRKGTFKLKMPNNCGFLHKQVLFLLSNQKSH